MIGRSMLILLAIVPAAAGAAPPRRTSAGEVAAAANRCGLRGLTVHRGGPRRFLVEQEAGEAMRPWHCLMRWGRQRRVGIEWAPPPIIVF